MARYSSVVRKRKKKGASFLPESWQIFLARRLIDGAGFLLIAAGALFMLALASYDPADPSWNTAGGDANRVTNLMGLSGAWMADIFLQTLGMGGFVPGLALCAWGGRVLRRDPLEPLPLRLACALFATLLAAAAFARLPAQGFIPQPWLGGTGGAIILDNLARIVRGFAGESAHVAAAGFSAFLCIPALLCALAVTRDEVAGVFAMARDFAVSTSCFFAGAFSAFMDWVRHYGRAEETEISAPKARTRRSPRLTEESDDEEEDEGEEEDETEETGPPAAPRVNRPAKKKPHARQGSFVLEGGGDWELPSTDLLREILDWSPDDRPDEAALHKNAQMLRSVLKDFNVEGEIVSISPGPVVTLYELEPAPGIKTSRVISLSDDIARSMAAVSVRSAVIPGRNVIGIELPNRKRQTVYMRELLETEEAQKTKAALPLILGKDIAGRPVIADLAKMPHLLVAGTTGSGKSVAVNTMILSLLFRLPPERCRFIMIDPKMLELSVYDDIPHLLSPVVTEPGKAVVALKWTVMEMEERYRAMSRLGVRNIEGYNERMRQALKKGETLMRKVQTGFDPDTGKPVYEEQPLDMAELPYIVVVVDEFADLMLVAGKDVENAVQRLAQMARAAGIHLIMATQRPSVDVITGVIKANFPTRISFQVTSKIDSRTILNEGGAEQLLGMGDMLYMAGGGRITRVHGPFVSDEDVENVVSFLKHQATPSYIEDITDSATFGGSEIMGALFGEEGGENESGDDLYDQAVAIVARERKASTSFIQRHLQIGYNRAARIIEEMERQGVVSPANRVGKREVLVGDYSEV